MKYKNKHKLQSIEQWTYKLNHALVKESSTLWGLSTDTFLKIDEIKK